MPHMDIDLRPPRSSHSTLHGFGIRQVSSMTSAKRARSPEIGHPFDRPAKRLLIGTHEAAMDSAEFSDGSYGFAPSVTTSRFPSEDWVSQARGLSIDNTTPDDSRSTNPSLENLGSQSGDVDMMDSEDTQSVPVSSFSGPSNQAPQTGFHPATQRPVSSLFSRVMQPEINVTPATPCSTVPSSVCNSTQDLTQLAHASIPLGGSPMSMTPTASFSQSLTPQPSRRPKFSMGPRADCEKCRLGVKGHWAHFD